MRKLLEKARALPLIWHIVFIIIAFLNLSVPLFLFSHQNNIEKIEDINEGLAAIDRPLSFDNGQLNTESETIEVNDQFVVSILNGVPEEDHYIVFAEANAFFNINGLEFEIDYSEDLENQDMLFLEIISAAQSNLILQGFANFIIAFLFNGIIYMAVLMGAKYFTKELYRNLFRFLTLPFVSVALLTSFISLTLNNYHLFIYFAAILIIGTLTAFNLKDIIDKRNTSYYLGNEEL